MQNTDLRQNATNIKTIWRQAPIVHDYFLRLNQGDFSGVSQLFAQEGCLYAPFHSGICGHKAIYDYLQKEARGMKAIPESGTIASLANAGIRCQLKGQVQTSLFTVNVGWTIELNATREITAVTVKLLAELTDLFGLSH